MSVFELLIVVLILLWLAGVGVGYTLGGAVHLLLLIVLLLVVVRLLQGRVI
jgi:hypothetical protein